MAPSDSRHALHTVRRQGIDGDRPSDPNGVKSQQASSKFPLLHAQAGFLFTRSARGIGT